jgi:hypothetical protein
MIEMPSTALSFTTGRGGIKVGRGKIMKTGGGGVGWQQTPTPTGPPSRQLIHVQPQLCIHLTTSSERRK